MIISASLPLATLADLDVLGENFPDTVDKPTFVVSADLEWSARNFTSGEGPIQVGVARADYTDAEIEAFLENQGAWGTSDLVATREIMNRQIRIAGQFKVMESDEVLNDGKPIRTPLRWLLNAGDTLKYWAYNRSGGTLTTGSTVLVSGTVWAKK